MAVYDRWHTAKPRTDEQGKPIPPCREHKQCPSVDHGKGDRWQVRWRDETGKQRKSNFAKKAGKDPNTCADAFDAKIRAALDAGTYVDPARGKILLGDFAKRWRSGLTGDPNTLWNVDKRLAHIIDVQPRPGQGKSRRPTGDPSVIANQPMSLLAARPSLVQQWIKSLELKGLSPGYIKRIFDTLSTIFIAAMEDGLVDRNPTKASSVKPPRVPKKKVVPWTLDQVESPDGPPHTARLIFTRPSGQPHYGGVFNYVWQRVRRAVGVPETPENGMHVLRHTAASAWLAAGVDIRTVAEYLGHADPGFTLRTYAHLLPDAADRARTAMDAFFASEGKIENASALHVPSDLGR
ncbi:tyrosine-type recombinase/integrase [Actinomadura sp. 3N407]|uniref:tyrosine-type recombinase/integrase n=1 Tax=Actinomadura sp. 3N407 TaxID=3457423 RepID=UPI003FCCF694